ncbi:reverse transcriptase domain-containing protein [Tanacetum coccineum]|uniref:Reverse transcriptase domain-containing protein n=1 Tax=Tanacetum coccineum TaxID=301880 RepID=A0ABQ5ACW0_9ASTR
MGDIAKMMMDEYIAKIRTNGGIDNEDANEHIENVLEIADMFHIPKVTKDQVVIVFCKGLDVPTKQMLNSRCPISKLTHVKGKKAILDVDDHSKIWQDGASRKRKEGDNSEGLSAIIAKIKNLGRKMNKVTERVNAIWVEEAKYGQFDGPPFLGNKVSTNNPKAITKEDDIQKNIPYMVKPDITNSISSSGMYFVEQVSQATSVKEKEEETPCDFSVEDLVEPWYVDIVNFIVTKFMRKGITMQQRRKFFDDEKLNILDHCHTGPTRGHYGTTLISKKVYEAIFFCPTIFKDVMSYVQLCNAWQRSGNTSSHDEMSQNQIQLCEVFDVWGIDFMVPFPKSKGNQYILVAIDYLSKWVEVEALPTNDARVVNHFLKRLFSRFGVPRALICYMATHFCNAQSGKVLKMAWMGRNADIKDGDSVNLSPQMLYSVAYRMLGVLQNGIQSTGYSELGMSLGGRRGMADGFPVTCPPAVCGWGERFEQIGTQVEQGQQTATQRDEMIAGLTQQVQALQAVVQQRDTQIQQLHTMVLEMSSRENSIIDLCIATKLLVPVSEVMLPGYLRIVIFMDTAYVDNMDTPWCMTTSSTKELLSPFENPEQKFRSRWRPFDTQSLVESNSPEFDHIFDIEEQSGEEVRETMTETMEKYMSKTRGDYGSGVTRPTINQDTHFELKGQFLKELRDNTFSCSEHEDANEHIEKILEIVDLFHILKITQDQIMLRAFPGAIPSKNAVDDKIAIKEMAEYYQKWQNGTSSRTKSTETSNGLAAIQA